MAEKNKIEDIKLADDVEYIIIQRENPNDIEKLDGEIIAKFAHNGYYIAGGYMLRTKFRENVKKSKERSKLQVVRKRTKREKIYAKKLKRMMIQFQKEMTELLSQNDKFTEIDDNLVSSEQEE